MEKIVKIPTPDDHITYGTLNSLKEKSSKLIIFVHGLTGDQYEHHYFNAVPFFTNKGFDTFRFDLYSDEEKGRNLTECSISIHTQDLMTVIDNFKERYQEIFLVGHSLGAPTILNANLNSISKIIIWDPTSGMRSLKEKNCEYNEKIDKYILNWSTQTILGQEMINDWKKASNLESLIKKITKPCKFIFAGKASNYSNWKPFLQKVTAPAPVEFMAIEEATHVFNEEGTEQRLFEETLKWLEK